MTGEPVSPSVGDLPGKVSPSRRTSERWSNQKRLALDAFLADLDAHIGRIQAVIQDARP